jgi:hypothetical protein
MHVAFSLVVITIETVGLGVWNFSSDMGAYWLGWAILCKSITDTEEKGEEGGRRQVWSKCHDCFILHSCSSLFSNHPHSQC